MFGKWITTGLMAGLLIAALAGCAAIASGSEPNEGEATEQVIVEDGNTSTMSVSNDDLDDTREPDELSIRIAEILGRDPQVTHMDMVQPAAAAEARKGNEGPQYTDSASAEA